MKLELYHTDKDRTWVAWARPTGPNQSKVTVDQNQSLYGIEINRFGQDRVFLLKNIENLKVQNNQLLYLNKTRPLGQANRAASFSILNI